MNDLSSLSSLGFSWPSPMYITGLLLFGIVGMFSWARGRAKKNSKLKYASLGMMLYPYVVYNTWLLWIIGLGIFGWMCTIWDQDET